MIIFTSLCAITLGRKPGGFTDFFIRSLFTLSLSFISCFFIFFLRRNSDVQEKNHGRILSIKRWDGGGGSKKKKKKLAPVFGTETTARITKRAAKTRQKKTTTIAATKKKRRSQENQIGERGYPGEERLVIVAKDGGAQRRRTRMNETLKRSLKIMSSTTTTSGHGR